MIEFDPERVRANAERATTEDLLDRATVYRGGMESAALEIIDRELHARGVSPAEVDAHEARRRHLILSGADGTARPCSFCDRPAVMEGWGWHRFWGLVPLFPRRFSYCDYHRPAGRSDSVQGPAC